MNMILSIGKRWKTIGFYDINSMYPCTFKEKFPTGLGFEWKYDDGSFKKTLMTDWKISLASVQWLDYVQMTSPIVVNKKGQRCRIFSGWNSKERKVGRYLVDGFCEVDDKTIVFEFDGCFYHACKVCKKYNEILDREQRARERERYFKNKGYILHSIKECEWKVKFDEIKATYKPSISPILFFNQITHLEMIRRMENDELYGFAIVDIEPTPAAQKFLDINWPPILLKEDIQFEDLPEWMQKSTKKSTFPRKTIVQSMHGKEILLHTTLIRFYLENGFDLTRIHHFFEYQGQTCFKDVYDTVYQARVEATETGDSLKATATKLCANAMYGIFLLVSL